MERVPSEDIISIAHITDCPTVTVHAGKCYQALIDSGATISLIRHSTYKQIKDCYKTPVLNVNISLDMANLQTVNITALHFHVWQHMGRNHSENQLQHLATIPSIPVHKVYQHLLNRSLQLTSFNTKPSEDTNTLWNLFTHTAVYISALRSLIPVGIGLFCCYFFWC